MAQNFGQDRHSKRASWQARPAMANAGRLAAILFRMRFRASLPSSMSLIALLAACASPLPDSPHVLALPGRGKSYAQFQADERTCRMFAQQQVASSGPNQTGATVGINGAAVGAVLGAVAGAAINGVHGAGVGAGTGLALGGVAGIDAVDTSAAALQRRYDIGYEQCMYAKGHRIPADEGFGGLLYPAFRERQPAAGTQ